MNTLLDNQLQGEAKEKLHGLFPRQATAKQTQDTAAPSLLGKKLSTAQQKLHKNQVSMNNKTTITKVRIVYTPVYAHVAVDNE